MKKKVEDFKGKLDDKKVHLDSKEKVSENNEIMKEFIFFKMKLKNIIVNIA